MQAILLSSNEVFVSYYYNGAEPYEDFPGQIPPCPLSSACLLSVEKL